MAELAYERFALALEATRGTAVTPPTHMVPLAGMLNPTVEYYTPDEARGTLAATTRTVRARENSEWSVEGGLDTYISPIIANMVVKGGVTAPTTPSGATNARLWEFVRSQTSTTLKTATLYWGDPNVQVWQAALGIAQEWVITSDGTGTDGSTQSVSGIAAFPTQVAAPTWPTTVFGNLISPMDMQVWLDTASAIGTTQLTGTVLSATHTIPSGLVGKPIPNGPGTSRSFSRIGIGKSSAVTTVVMELSDTTQYDLFEAETSVKLRVRHNGPLIEATFYEYVEVDGYGPLRFDSWSDFEGTNRTVAFTLVHEPDPTLGSDLRVAIQSARTAL
jgi:hypothetical protein